MASSPFRLKTGGFLLFLLSSLRLNRAGIRFSLVSIRKLWMNTVQFSYGKRTIFPKVKEVKRLRGGVAVYAAQASVRIDAEIGGNGRFRMKTSLGDCRVYHEPTAKSSDRPIFSTIFAK